MGHRLWVVSEVYYPEETSTGYYLTAIAEGLSDRFDVKVLCGQPNYSARGVRAVKREMRKGVEIFRAAGTRLNKNIVVFRLINMVTLGFSVLMRGLWRFRRGDKVLVVTTPPSMPFIVAMASLIRGASYTLLIHDSYPEVLVAVSNLQEGSIAVRTVHFMNRWLFKHTSKIIVVGRDMKKLIEKKTVGLHIPVAVIPNWAEVEDVQPLKREQNELIRELGLSEKLIVLHAGNIGHPTDVETVVECLHLLRDDERFHFVFIGSGVKKKQLETALRRYELKNLTLLEPRPRTDQSEFLNACDIGLVSLVPGMYGAAMPSKTYNIMAAGKPVLALTDEGSELATVIEEEQVGWHLPPGNAKLLVSKIKDIYETKDTLCEIGERARKATERKYSLESALNRYAAELDQ